MTNFAGEFGELIIETDVDEAVIGQLKMWYETYLYQIEGKRGLVAGSVQRPKSFTSTLEDDTFLDPTLPAIIVTTARTTEAPALTPDGKYYGPWRVIVSVVTRGRTSPEARFYAALYGGATRLIMVDQGSLGGFSQNVKWRGGGLERVELDENDARYLVAAVNEFDVYLEDVLQAGNGPMYPDSPEYPPIDPTNPEYEPLVSVTQVTTEITAKQGT